MQRVTWALILLSASVAVCPTLARERTLRPIKPARPSELERGLADFPDLDAERDWPWWRGPTRNGIAAEQDAPPLEWSADENVRWKAPVPGRGHASPIVVGDAVYLATADEVRKVQLVVAFDRDTGEALWQTPVHRGGLPKKIYPKNSHASPTLASDGRRLYATFFNDETIAVSALDLKGEIVWQAEAGRFNPKEFEEGYAPSPCLYRGLLLFSLEYDGDSYLVALDRKSGDEVWRTPRPENVTYSPPIVARLAGRDQLIISGSHMLASYDPNTGDELWTVEGGSQRTCGSIVWDDDCVFASGGDPESVTWCVRADGEGEILWTNNRICYEQSMLAYAGAIYALTDKGLLYCWRATDGEELWRERLSGPVSASPVLANGYIYQSNGEGVTYVFRADPERFELEAENRLGDESLASPAICGGQVFLRVAFFEGDDRQEFLYCLAD